MNPVLQAKSNIGLSLFVIIFFLVLLTIMIRIDYDGVMFLLPFIILIFILMFGAVIFNSFIYNYYKSETKATFAFKSLIAILTFPFYQYFILLV